MEHSAFDMEMIFHSHANKTHFHKEGCALGLILKVRVFGTWKWPTAHNMLNRGTVTIPREYLHVKLIKLRKKVHKCVSYLGLFKGNKAVSPISCLSFGCTKSTVRSNREFKQRHFSATHDNLCLIICLDSTKFVVPTSFILKRRFAGKFGRNRCPRRHKVQFRLKCIAQTTLCFKSLITCFQHTF